MIEGNFCRSLRLLGRAGYTQIFPVGVAQIIRVLYLRITFGASGQPFAPIRMIDFVTVISAHAVTHCWNEP